MVERDLPKVDVASSNLVIRSMSFNGFPNAALDFYDDLELDNTKSFWQAHKQRILAGHVHDVFPYDTAKRFKNQRRLAAAQQGAAVAHPPSEVAALSLPS